jgi:hypothetical protein
LATPQRTRSAWNTALSLAGCGFPGGAAIVPRIRRKGLFWFFSPGFFGVIAGARKFATPADIIGIWRLL